jgi:hypothetical protein
MHLQEENWAQERPTRRYQEPLRPRHVFSCLILKANINTRCLRIWIGSVGSMDSVHSETSSGSIRTHRFMTNWRYCDETVEIHEEGSVGKLPGRKPSNRTITGPIVPPRSKWRLHVFPFVPASKSARNIFSQLTLPLSPFLRVTC